VKIIDDLIGSIEGDALAREVRVGPLLTAVWSRGCGLASTLGRGEHNHGAAFVRDAGSLAGRSALELARLAYSDRPLEAGIGMAAVNSLLNVDDSRCVDLNARDLLIDRGRGKKVALVGHFPFVPALREAAAQLWVIELEPRPGDLAAEQGEALIPQADIVAITGSAFINHTVGHLLSLCRPESVVMLLGPTAPLSPVLFDHGVDIISGTCVVDPERALRCLSEGATFRQMQGVRLLTMQRRATRG
jgi:uncharacterized protein (DUF4213/DUF364 family)